MVACELINRLKKVGLENHAKVVAVINSRRQSEGNPHIGGCIERMILRDLSAKESLALGSV